MSKARKNTTAKVAKSPTAEKARAKAGRMIRAAADILAKYPEPKASPDPVQEAKAECWSIVSKLETEVMHAKELAGALLKLTLERDCCGLHDMEENQFQVLNHTLLEIHAQKTDALNAAFQALMTEIQKPAA